MSKNTIIIRADATRDIGTGHIMRCLALSQAWQKHGGKVVWVTHCDSEKMLSKLRQKDSKLYELSKSSNFREMYKIINEESPCWIVLDGYQFDSEYQKGLYELGAKLFVIDDYAHLDRYYAHIILNQNFGADKFNYHALPQTKLLLGADYIMLRSEFCNYKGYKKEIKDKAENILVTMGGSDAENYTLKMLTALEMIDIPLSIKVPIGANNPNLDSIKDIANKSKHSTEVIYDSQEMPALMAWSDVAISAGGTTTWELLFMGVPSILCITTDNQEDIVKSLSKDDIVISLEWLKRNDLTDFKDIFIGLISNKKRREEMSRHSSTIIDGIGTERVLKVLWQ